MGRPSERVNAPKTPPPELAEHEDQHEEQADAARLAEHLAVRDASFDAFVDRKAAAEHEDAVQGDRHQQHADAPSPVQSAAHPQRDARHTPRDHARRPARVEDVEPGRLVVPVQGRDEGVGDGLRRAVPDRDEERAGVQPPVPLGEQQDQRGRHVTGEGEAQAFAVADAVRHQAHQHDGRGERPQPHPEDLALLRFGQPELARPVADHLAAHGEDRRRRG
ncbi:MAG: hypothetical protein NTY02_05530, partial [Acidobacteria bacterium]|nr:hypothetical protein [Acidobacteriota bacterium]